MLAVHCSTTTLPTGVMQGGHAEVVQVLLEQGATPDKHTSDGYTPLALAAEVTAMRGIVLFTVDGSLTMAVTRIMQYGKADVVEVLLGKGANFDKPTTKGNTLLAWAAKFIA